MVSSRVHFIDRRVLVGSVVIVLAVVLIGSRSPEVSDWLTGTAAKSDVSVLDDSGATVSTVKATVDASNRFSFDLYRRYSSDGGNVLFSPYSISTALSMTYEGARGETADEMEVFHFVEEPSERRPAVVWIYNVINGKDRDYELHAANALWMQEGYPILRDYVDTVVNFYGGEANSLDFSGAPEESRVIINDWVEERTNDRIKDLLPPNSINPEVALVLTNAIYFKGDWLIEFDVEGTKKEEFHVSPTESVEADMMSLRGERFNYTETDDMQVLELPYTGKDVSMMILLPKENDLGDIEATLSCEGLGESIDWLKETSVDVYLPRFTFETKYFMKEDLIEMGMPTAFTPSADFTGITEVEVLFIDKVIHQAFIEVNEEGTEAAAATGVVMKRSGATPPSKVFRADHPFIFIIRDRVTGVILFMGRVMTPI
jgi:serpin B